MKPKVKTLRPDSQGRVGLGIFAKDIALFKAWRDDKNRIILEPQVEIPAYEKWLFDNEVAKAKVQQGLKDAVSQPLQDLGTFSQHLNDEIE